MRLPAGPALSVAKGRGKGVLTVESVVQAYSLFSSTKRDPTCHPERLLLGRAYETRSFAPAALRMTGSLASIGKEEEKKAGHVRARMMTVVRARSTILVGHAHLLHLYHGESLPGAVHRRYK